MDNPKRTITVLLVVAGVLFVVALGLAAYLASTRERGAEAEMASNNAEMPPSALETPAPPAEERLATPEPENREGVAEDVEGREELSLAAAQKRKPGWNLRLSQHSPDWQQVSISAGADPGKWTATVVFEWDGRQYVFVRETPVRAPATPRPKPAAKPPAVAAQKPLTEKDLAGVPEEFRPSESTALEAALVGHEDWIGKIQSHGKDWAGAVVWIGPPNSEWVSAITLKWNVQKQCYEVAKQANVPSGG